MTATTLTPATTVPHRLDRLAHGLRAIRAFGSAAASVVLLGSYDGLEEAGVRSPRPAHLGRPAHVGRPAA
ncbi:hypothetical protein ABZ135_15350 [Streptomyces sp. NPDC006339]|uniref:hypothetical protein n=1 Tax=Streptomyces sp. NPDC006339 TaxID=3156755 RepID=UPI0033B27EFA